MGKYLDILEKAQQGENAEPYGRARIGALEADAAGHDLAAHLRQHAPDLLDETQDRSVTAAQSLITTCRRYGISLKLDADGRLIIGRSDLNGAEPALWPTLVTAISAHLPAVEKLVAAGWSLRTDPKLTAA
jgi:hypothetical protein